MRIFLGYRNSTEENKWLVYKKNLGKLINIVPEKVLEFNDIKKKLIKSVSNVPRFDPKMTKIGHNISNNNSYSLFY